MLSWLLVLAQLPMAAPPALAPSCARALAAVAGASACAASRHGIALAASQAEADRLMARAVGGEERFADVFGRPPSAYAVYAFPDPAAIAGAQQVLRQLGLPAFLPVPSAGFLQRQRERMAAAAAGGGRIVMRAPAGASDEPMDAEGENKIPHELGHLWYAQIFWADAPRRDGDRYGSAAPDWLDEIAAMMMESDTRTAIYRNRFTDSRDPARASDLPPEIPLAELVTMPHPVSASLPPPGQASGPIRLTSAPSLFYAQTRVFADYLIERSGDPRILATISEESRGSDFAGWLTRHGARHRLPSSLSAMDTDWQAWTNRRFGPPVR